MSTATEPLLETLVTDFGGNYVFALDLLEMYREDRGSVDPSWRTYFDKATDLPDDSWSRRSLKSVHPATWITQLETLSHT